MTISNDEKQALRLINMLESKMEEDRYFSLLNRVYGYSNLVQNYLFGNLLRAFISFLALYSISNNLNFTDELAFLLNLQKIAPDLNPAFLTFFLSLSIVTSGYVSTTRKEQMFVLEERLALKATSGVRNQIKAQSSRLDKIEDNIYLLQTDVATLKADVEELKIGFNNLTTKVDNLQLDVTNILNILQNR